MNSGRDNALSQQQSFRIGKPHGSPHSDTALSSNAVSASQNQQQRPFSVPLGTSEHSYAARDFADQKLGPGSHQQQQTIAEVEELEDFGSGQHQQEDSKMFLDDSEVVTLEAEGPPGSAISSRAIEETADDNSPMLLLQQSSLNPASIGGFTNNTEESQSPSKSIIMDQSQKTAEQREEEQQQRQMIRQRRREPILLDSRALQRAMLPQKLNEPSPLEQFLLGQTLLARLRPFFELAERESLRRERGTLNLQIRELHWAEGVLSVTFPSYAIPLNNQHTHQCVIRMQLFICPKEFRLVTKLEYSGPSSCPAESDVRIFERFFAEQVVRMNNEMAVFAFIHLCRLSSQSIFSSLAQMLQAQMEPQLYTWQMEFELLHMADPQPTAGGGQTPGQQPAGQKAGGQPQKVVKFSIQTSESCKQFVFIIYLQPANAQTSRTERRRVCLRYGVERNELSLHSQQMSEMDQRISSALAAQTEIINKQPPSADGQPLPCCIWPCIRSLLQSGLN